MTTTSNKPAIAVSQQSVDLSSPKGLVDFAKTLKEFIVNEHLYVRIQNKNYVVVEGWQFAGAATGVFPVVKSVERIETKDPTEIRYRAEVKLKRLMDNTMVGYGVAICSNKESGRHNQDEYVIASMAQTRATGKAFRNVFAWLMKMAGYEATPAEEMDSGSPAQASSTSPDIDIDVLKEKIKKAKTTADLDKIHDTLPPNLRLELIDLFSERLLEIQGNGTTNS